MNENITNNTPETNKDECLCKVIDCICKNGATGPTGATGATGIQGPTGPTHPVKSVKYSNF